MDPSEINNRGIRGWASGVGGKLKEIGTTLWLNPNTDANNESGFSALPAGSRDNEGFYINRGRDTHFWSSTVDSFNYPFIRSLAYETSGIYRNYSAKLAGFSVRCIKD